MPVLARENGRKGGGEEKNEEKENCYNYLNKTMKISTYRSLILSSEVDILQLLQNPSPTPLLSLTQTFFLHVIPSDSSVKGSNIRMTWGPLGQEIPRALPLLEI